MGPNKQIVHAGQPVSMTNPLPVTLTSPAAVASYTDGSGTIAVAATSQQVFAANSARKYFFFLNLSDTDMWINFGTPAVASQPSIKIPANGGYFEPLVVSDDAVNVICGSNTKAFTAKQA